MNQWNDLTDEQKRTLVDLYSREKNTARLVNYVEEEFGFILSPNNLGRRIREYRAYLKGVSEVHETKQDQETFKSTQLDHNNIEVVYVGDTIHSLEDLLTKTNVDRKEWVVVSHTVNTWEGFRARGKKDLSFASGSISGSIEDDGGVTVVPLYQVKARLVRRNPVALEPVIAPILIDVKEPEPLGLEESVSKNGLRTALILSDPQFGFFRDGQMGPLVPFHDRSALSAALVFAADLKPDEIIWVGDLLDLPEWSTKFAIDPMMYLTTQPALMEAAWWLAQFSPISRKKTLLEGNHDKRLKDMFMSRLPAAYGLRGLNVEGTEVTIKAENIYDLPVLLDLDSIDVEYIDGYPNNGYWLGDLEVLHGNVARGKPMATVSGVVGNYNHSTIFGHIHSLERASRTVYTSKGPRTITAASVGCMCRLDHVVPGHRRGQSWQQGVGVVTYGKGIEQIDLIEIKDGSLVYGGNLYEGEAIKKDVQRGMKQLKVR